MSKILTAVIDENRNFVISPSEGFSGDSIAELIEIDIGPFADEGFEYYILNYEVFPTNGIFNSNIIRTDTDEPAYISNGVIYLPLTSQLTASGRLRIQLEAHKKTEKGEVIKKSSIAELEFKESLQGESELLGNSPSVLGRLEDIEDRLDKIDSENYGGKISSLESIASSLENEVSALSSRAGNAENRLEALEGYNIPQNLAGIEERLTALEDEPDGLEAIPVASENTLGGITVRSGSEFNINESGRLSLDYSAINSFRLAATFVLSLLHIPSSVETIVSNSADEISSYVSDCTSQVSSGFMNAFAFACFSDGNVEYTDEAFNLCSMQVEANTVYVFKLVDGVLQCKSYIGNELRTLILEGI